MTTWEYTAPTGDKAGECWSGLKTYTDAACSAGEGTGMDATGKVDTLSTTAATGSNKWYIAACTGTKFTLFDTDKTDLAEAKTAYATEAAKATPPATLKTVTFTAPKDSASVCATWTAADADASPAVVAVYAKFTAAGYAAPKKADDKKTATTGAKTLAAAFTAGALAVAATQF